RREHPGAGHPVIAIGSISPIPWNPDVIRTGRKRLLVHRYRGWCKVDRDERSGARDGRRDQQRRDERKRPCETQVREKRHVIDSSGWVVPLTAQRDAQLTGGAWQAVISGHPGEGRDPS